MFEFVIRNS